MKFLVDNALSPQVSLGLNEAGYDSAHVRDYNMQSAADVDIFELAKKQDRILISADTDFGTLLALGQDSKPSFILFRRGTARQPKLQIKILVANLPNLENSLNSGCVAVFETGRIRIRPLPIGEET